MFTHFAKLSNYHEKVKSQSKHICEKTIKTLNSEIE